MSNANQTNGLTGSQPEIRRTVVIVNRRGLHARAAAKFVQVAGRFDAEITVVKNNVAVSALSLLGLMMLGASPGEEIELRAQGPHAASAVESLMLLVTNRFDED